VPIHLNRGPPHPLLPTGASRPAHLLLAPRVNLARQLVALPSTKATVAAGTLTTPRRAQEEAMKPFSNDSAGPMPLDLKTSPHRKAAGTRASDLLPTHLLLAAQTLLILLMLLLPTPSPRSTISSATPSARSRKAGDCSRLPLSPQARRSTRRLFSRE
jgi:hypothetical protein